MSSIPAAFSLRDPPNAQDKELFSCRHCKGKKTGRNLIVCFDGTSNQFGEFVLISHPSFERFIHPTVPLLQNTNVIELYDLVIKDETQPTYYNSGIGTYARPSFASYTYVKQVLDNTIDLAIAWNFERVLLGGYRWLSENYKPGDKIYLFGKLLVYVLFVTKVLTWFCCTGFSRGAYQVRALAGMIHEVGLILPGNEEQIPFVYELYADLKGRKSDRSGDEGGRSLNMAQRFKRTFSQQEAAVHFLGAWDTVSSIGVVRGKTLPATDEFSHICYFRHALALDERRVKFLPEYVCGGESYEGTGEDIHRDHGPHVKEVWFAGCHSDIGGGSKKNTQLNNAAVPVLWMGREAMIAGLKLYPSKVIWDWDELRETKPTESLTWVWRVFEMFPFKRLSYTGRKDTTWWPNLWTGRTIKKGQKIHASVAFIRDYMPQATLPDGLPIRRWEDILERGKQDTTDWAEGLEDLLEMDFFNPSDTKAVIGLINDDTGDTVLHSRLAFIASTRDGAVEIGRVDPELAIFRKMLGSANDEVKLAGMAMLVDLALHGVTYVPLLAETLTSETSGIRIRGAEIFRQLVYDTNSLSQCMRSGVAKLLVKMANPNLAHVPDESRVAREAFLALNTAKRKQGIQMVCNLFASMSN
ncbi:hypothetical protein BV22DRAFT_1129559 [Leucogyrophana mollusca]|uniref:Uncharacterized protein n=1 Tax=Leucogyrophana mollusca TaxID=85980 RepID=A0ACB8BGW0_9AGAM|nr:hypothetical protein BV22DRAFT_1129559 [Leucogyrophana mollusca]